MWTKEISCFCMAFMPVCSQGYQAKVLSLHNQNNTISINFTSNSDRKIIIEVPYSVLKNTDFQDLLNSRAYIDGAQYSNFSLVISSNYTIVLEIYNLKPGDPTAYWAYSPNSVIPAYYSLTFKKQGLPAGTPWSVTINNQTYKSTGRL